MLWRTIVCALAAAGAAPAQEITHQSVGHEFRQDDMPALAASPDGSLWVAWVSWVGDRDDVVLRHWKDGAWKNLHWVPGTSGDSWMPQVAVDASNRVWVVWTQQESGNWDLYARRFDPLAQEWGGLQRLSSHPLPDINPRVAGDGRGGFAVVWQGFRGGHSNIFARSFDGEGWSSEIRVTERAANDWEPAASFDSSGALWVAYDSYQNGNYDVFLKRIADGKPGEEITVAATPRFEARPTVTVDTAGRVWVAWEAGAPNWGKDQGYVIRRDQPGAPLGGPREPRVRVREGGAWRSPAQPLAAAFPARRGVHQPHLVADGMGSVTVIAKVRTSIPNPNGRGQRGYWSYWLTRYEGERWAAAEELPASRGRSSTRPTSALLRDGSLWLAWDTDNRREAFYHRPIRQEILAGRLGAPPPVAAPSWSEPPAESIEAAPGHADEAGDLRAIRAYSADFGGRRLRIVRGDFHRHTELSWDGGGAADGNLVDFYRYMIDAGGMDFGASTDHQGGVWPYWWWYSQKLTDMYHVPGAYVSIFGYERSAVFPNGHRNMFFARRSEARVTPWFLKEGARQFGLPTGPQGDEPGIGTGELVENDTKLLYEDVRKLNGIAISHTSGTRMGTDWRDNDPDLEPVVEIYQGARTSYERLGAPLVVDVKEDQEHMERAGYQPEGMVHNAWAMGYKLGIIASSDHGSTHISYAMVYTDDFSRRGVLDAIRKRHTYGASDNIILDVRMGEHFMGDEFRMERPLPIRVKALAPRNIVKVDVIKDNEVVYSTQPNFRNVDFEFRDQGPMEGRHFYYVRVQQEDRRIAWSSPFFANY